MSLIADALRAAQETRSTPRDDRRETARRLLSAPADSPSGAVARARGGTLFALRVPRELRIAGGVFAIAVAAAATLVALAPGVETARTAEPVRRRPSALARGLDAPPAVASEVPPTAPLDPGRALAAAAPAATGLLPLGDPPAPRPGPPAAAVASPPAAAPPPAMAEERSPVEGSEADGRLEIRLEGDAPVGGRLFEQALAAQRGRDFPRAIDLYRRVVQQDPSHAEAHNNLGATLQSMGQLEPARDALRQAVALQPRFSSAWSNLGVVLGSLGDAEGSQVALSEAIRLDPDNHGAMVNLALHFQKRQLPADAQRLLEQVLAASPRHSEAHYALARLLDQQGDAGGAVRHYRLFLTTARARFPQVEAPVRQRLQQLVGGGDDA